MFKSDLKYYFCKQIIPSYSGWKSDCPRSACCLKVRIYFLDLVSQSNIYYVSYNKKSYYGSPHSEQQFFSLLLSAAFAMGLALLTPRAGCISLSLWV